MSPCFVRYRMVYTSLHRLAQFIHGGLFSFPGSRIIINFIIIVVKREKLDCVLIVKLFVYEEQRKEKYNSYL